MATITITQTRQVTKDLLTACIENIDQTDPETKQMLIEVMNNATKGEGAEEDVSAVKSIQENANVLVGMSDYMDQEHLQRLVKQLTISLSRSSFKSHGLTVALLAANSVLGMKDEEIAVKDQEIEKLRNMTEAKRAEEAEKLRLYTEEKCRLIKPRVARKCELKGILLKHWLKR